MEDNYLHVLLITASALHKKKSRQRFQELNLSEGQPKVLSVLQGIEGCLQKELAKACHVEPATMTSLLKNMEKQGLIRKETDFVSGSKRAYRIYFTEKGRGLAGEVNDIVRELEEICFCNFTDSEKDAFLKYFRKVVDNMEQDRTVTMSGKSSQGVIGDNNQYAEAATFQC